MHDESLPQNLRKKQMDAERKPTSLDFFAGSGLASLALSDSFQVVWANDICPQKAQVYRANHGADHFHLGPLEKVAGAKIPAVHLSWGSFPCQDLSLAGNMSGLLGARSGLFWEWLRVMDEMPVRPPIAVAENVQGLVSSAGGENYRQVHQALLERGYHVGAVLLDAAHWVPQSRKRVFVIAVDRNLDISAFAGNYPTWCHPQVICNVARTIKDWIWWKLPPPPPFRQNLDAIVDFSAPCDTEEKSKRIQALIPEAHMAKLWDAVEAGQRVFPGYKRTRYGKQVLELRFDGIAGCLRTPGGGSSRQTLVICKDDKLYTRLLTVREAALLMGAPGDYNVPGSYNDGYKAMGDAIAVPVVRFLANHLLAPIAGQVSHLQSIEVAL